MFSQLPSLSTKIREELNSPITLEELQLAVGEIKTGKASGPDGYTIQYYKTFLPILGPYLVKLFNAVQFRYDFP